MRALISWLSSSNLARGVIRSLRIHRLANAWLKRFPMERRLPGSGVIYRATRVESIPLAREMFEKGALYDPTLLPADFTNIVDLGCNVGYFTCWLAHLAQGRKLRGLMIDANPAAVVDAQWHATANGMNEVSGLHGIVGEGAAGSSAEFYIYESNICSMSELPDVEAMGLKGKWEKISVPHVVVEEEWRKRFNGSRCHILKIDIEGSELNFLRQEAAFLRLVDCVVIEWHKWRVNFSEIQQFLVEHKFTHVKTLEENDQMGTAVFRAAI